MEKRLDINKMLPRADKEAMRTRVAYMDHESMIFRQGRQWSEGSQSSKRFIVQYRLGTTWLKVEGLYSKDDAIAIRERYGKRYPAVVTVKS